jgi:hypothetical protein
MLGKYLTYLMLGKYLTYLMLGTYLMSGKYLTYFMLGTYLMLGTLNYFRVFSKLFTMQALIIGLGGSSHSSNKLQDSQ